MYEGWWHKGKQHGIGTYHEPAKRSIRFGIWENGKRIRWFDKTETSQIAQGLKDFRTEFTEPESASVLPDHVTFEKPADFNRGMQEVKTRLNITW